MLSGQGLAMKNFNQLRLEYLTKASQARHHATLAADAKIRAGWEMAADGYAELAAECASLIRNRAGAQRSEAA